MYGVLIVMPIGAILLLRWDKWMSSRSVAWASLSVYKVTGRAGRGEGAGGNGLDHGGLKNPADAPMMPAGRPGGLAGPCRGEAIS
jgi:hypothetical protein